MRTNEYDSLEKFIYEYENGRHSSIDDSHGRKFMGIEFFYNGVYYRVCREPLNDDERPKLGNGKLGFYNVSIMHCEEKGYPIAENFESVGWYSDIYDLLDHCVITGKIFREVIMDDKTKILSKD